MLLDGVAIRIRRFLDFLDRDSPTRVGQLQYLARKGVQGRTQRLLLFNLRSEIVLLLRHCLQEKHQPVFPVPFSLADGLLGAAQREIVAILIISHVLLLPFTNYKKRSRITNDITTSASPDFNI